MTLLKGNCFETLKTLDTASVDSIVTETDTTEYPPEGQNVECDTWLGSRPHQASSRLHPGLDLTTVTTTNAVSEEKNYEPAIKPMSS